MTSKEFITSLPARVNPAALEGLSTLFHFDIEGEGGGQYTLKIADNKMEVLEGLVGEPNCKVAAKDANLMGVVSGEINGAMAVMMGKVKVSNVGEMLKYAKILGLMKS